MGCFGRVEERRGGLGHSASPRFLSPLIEPDVRIARIRLSDRLHHMAHGGRPLDPGVLRRHRGRCPPSPCGRACSERSGSLSVLPGAMPIAFTSPSSQACQKSGSFAPPALPAINAHMTLSDSRLDRRLETTLRPQPSPETGLPRLPGSPFRRAVPTTPADRTGARVDFFPARAAFPKWQEGRHPHCPFRGLLRLHACYGPPDRSAAQGDLCHEASARPVTRTKPLVSYRTDRQLSVWIPPPLVFRAFGAHCQEATFRRLKTTPNPARPKQRGRCRRSAGHS